MQKKSIEKREIPKIDPNIIEKGRAKKHLEEILLALDEMPKDEWLTLARAHYKLGLKTQVSAINKLFFMLSQKSEYKFSSLIKKYYLQADRTQKFKMRENFFGQRVRLNSQKIYDLIFFLTKRDANLIKLIFDNWDNYTANHFDQSIFR